MQRYSPVKYLYQLAALIQREHGVDVQEIWKKQKLPFPDDDADFVDKDVFKCACDLAIECVDDPILGLKFGQQMSSTHFGALGAAMMSCETIADVLDLAVTYSPTFLPFDIEIIEKTGAVSITVGFPDASSTYSKFNMQIAAAGSVRFLEDVTGYIPNQMKVQFPFAKPPADLLSQYRHYVPVKLVFDAREASVILPKSCLSDRLPRRDSVSKKLFLEVCQDIQKRIKRKEVLTGHILQILDSYSSYPGIEQISNTLKISSRTLRYQLKKENTSYREITLQHRLRRAGRLLRESKLSIDAIADEVGYCDTPSFYRAFKKEMGCTPAEYRSTPRGA
ncbi:AraC family transcriptional regulator [Pseudomaricurvus alkylphenolicus]|jgi:AraC-like DNA-binding protein|uniref:AraC family transcriptional regulator n=1 Tax=Pseudomaricurvus alkylphenolicus TaxID=1306991 RepID=UPI00141F2810|nr:AraC family transcriptional regulator [Pseudomaricurvus alkylphenolicus]NIB40566.1 AraC family transcriptional regulator [Pseudomaricurvus alkylphenolicus]